MLLFIIYTRPKTDTQQNTLRAHEMGRYQNAIYAFGWIVNKRVAKRAPAKLISKDHQRSLIKAGKQRKEREVKIVAAAAKKSSDSPVSKELEKAKEEVKSMKYANLWEQIEAFAKEQGLLCENLDSESFDLDGEGKQLDAILISDPAYRIESHCKGYAEHIRLPSGIQKILIQHAPLHEDAFRIGMELFAADPKWQNVLSASW